MSIKIKSIAIFAASILAIAYSVDPVHAASKGTAKMIERLDMDASGEITATEIDTTRVARVKERRPRAADRRAARELCADQLSLEPKKG